MSVCIQTPFAYREVMLHVYENAYIAFADMTVRDNDLQLRMRGIQNVLVLFYTSMSCEFAIECADLVSGVVSLWTNYTQWATAKGISVDIGVNTNEEKVVLLDCGAAIESLQFDAICKTYHLEPLRHFDSPLRATVNFCRINLNWFDDAIRARLLDTLRGMYIHWVCTQMHAALQQGVLKCKLPLTAPVDLSVLRKDNAWEDAAMLVMLSSDDTTFATLLKQWPMEEPCPHQHARKLLHFRALLQCQRPITDVDGVVRALQHNNDYLQMFYENWCFTHLREFLFTVKIDSLTELKALYRVMKQSNKLFAHFAVNRLVATSSDFKPMLSFLCQLPDAGLHDTNMQTMFALDPHTVKTLLTLS